MTTLDTRLAAAKLWLITSEAPSGASQVGDLPYLATAVYALTTVPRHEVATLATDEHWRLYVNPEWAATADIPVIAHGIAHVVWHLLYDHAARARAMQVDKRTADHWGTATDVTVGETLTMSGCTAHGLPTPTEHRLSAMRSPEEHYARLSSLPVVNFDHLAPGASKPAVAPQGFARRSSGSGGAGKLDDSCGSGADGIRRDYELPDTEDLGALSPMAQDAVREQVAIAFRGRVTGRGTSPGEWSRWTNRILDPVVPWQSVLASSVRRAVAWAAGTADYTYSRRSRRQAAQPQVILPGMHRPVPRVTLVVDTSGSVDDVLLGQALGEVDGALAALGVAGSAVSVVACDAAVQTVSRVRSAKDVRLAGGGGTDMGPAIAQAAAERPRPDVVIVLTDGYTPWPTDPPAGAAVITAILGRVGDALPPTPSWATRVECVTDG